MLEILTALVIAAAPVKCGDAFKGKQYTVEQRKQVRDWCKHQRLPAPVIIGKTHA